jgi:uncharacterized protein YndB with AHSA1/START domain
MGANDSHELGTTTPSDTEIVMTRVFDAPRELVFDAHSSCEHLAHWWGPRRYEVASCEIDFRVGGAWRIALRGPEGEVTFFGVYLEIARPERIVWTFGFDDMPGGPETYMFEEHDGRTTLTSTAVFGSVKERDAALGSRMEAGAIETFFFNDTSPAALYTHAVG